jgi:hypothetical protein
VIGLKKKSKRNSMAEIPTAASFHQNYIEENYPDSRIDIEEMMIEFAKMHVEAALKEASEKAKASLGKDWIRKEETIHPGQLVDAIIIKVDKDSILNSYPLSNIK